MPSAPNKCTIKAGLVGLPANSGLSDHTLALPCGVIFHTFPMNGSVTKMFPAASNARSFGKVSALKWANWVTWPEAEMRNTLAASSAGLKPPLLA
ncbi:hypothetical protein [uncultured Thiodictyon sp.]|uniref:hypothetical protein n=1 Tax=uncultured Thiodictyon sp. TaxID=1846217 RepID=UPI0025F458F1|nr:hypothetical protein [uncultured Thiodictyon sp.]